MIKKTHIALVAALLMAGVALVRMPLAEGMTTPKSEVASHQALRKASEDRIVIRVGQKAFAVDLYDNATAKDLITRLPLKLKANNYPGYDEKVIRLPQALSMNGASRGDEPEIPEVGYYQPGQWVALYFGNIGYWEGKVPLGRIHATVDELRAIPDNAPVTIELVSKP